MSQTIEDQVQNVLIGQIVKNVLSVTPPSDDVVGTKNAEAL
jgi:L-cysteine desulfidase